MDILDPFHFCRDDPQFFTDDFFTDDFHRGIAVWAVLVLAKLSLAGGISFSGMREKGIQKTGASSITNLGFATRQFSHFQQYLEAPGGRIRDVGKIGCRRATHA